MVDRNKEDIIEKNKLFNSSGASNIIREIAKYQNILTKDEINDLIYNSNGDFNILEAIFVHQILPYITMDQIIPHSMISEERLFNKERIRYIRDNFCNFRKVTTMFENILKKDENKLSLNNSINRIYNIIDGSLKGKKNYTNIFNDAFNNFPLLKTAINSNQKELRLGNMIFRSISSQNLTYSKEI